MNGGVSPTRYPLAWPAGKPRTRFRSFQRPFKTERTSIPVSRALDRLDVELRRLGAKHNIISSNLPLRNDGWPRADARRPDDPGVAVYFNLDGTPTVLACDSYDDIAQNFAAIAKHIEASRAIERYGVASLKEIFRGYAALPSSIAPEDWRTVLGDPKTRAAAEEAYREAIKVAHPDRGGSEARAAELNAAIKKAREVLK